MNKTLILLATGALACAAGCTSRIETAQLRIIDTDSDASFDGNDLVNGDLADASLGLTIVEGLAAVIEINVGDGDPLDEEYEGDGDTFARAESENIIVYPISGDDEQRRFMLTTTRGGGDFKARGAMMVSSSSYEGELRVPVRILRQGSYDHVSTLSPWTDLR